MTMLAHISLPLLLLLLSLSLSLCGVRSCTKGSYIDAQGDLDLAASSGNDPLTVPAGGARPAPPVGAGPGQYRLNLMAFCKDFNARTQKYKPDTPMSVTITAFRDNTFEFTVKSPSVTWYLKKAAGCSNYCQYMSLESIRKSIISTANTMGIKVVKDLD